MIITLRPYKTLCFIVHVLLCIIGTVVISIVLNASIVNMVYKYGRVLCMFPEYVYVSDV